MIQQNCLDNAELGKRKFVIKGVNNSSNFFENSFKHETELGEANIINISYRLEVGLAPVNKATVVDR